ncbi:MAG: hypothetical protein AABY22_07900 [Nanoarchaeota archaeon]
MKNCVVCNKEFDSKRTKYCSPNCCWKFHREKRKEYNQEYQKKYQKIYNQTYYPEHKELLIQKSNQYRKQNKEKINLYWRKWRKTHKGQKNIYALKHKIKYPIKHKARIYANRHKQRSSKCSKCEATEDLHFHHTNYEKNEGFTLCRECHWKIHKK